MTTNKTPFFHKLKLVLHYSVPQFLLTKLAGFLAERNEKFIARPFIWLFSKYYQINLFEAKKQNIKDYANFNEFFVRELKEGARPVAQGDDLVCFPADGKILECGKLDNNLMLQAKGHYFTLSSLLAGNEELAAEFKNGSFVTTYLAPHNYHKVHMPVDGTLKQMTYVPGDLFSVSPFVASNIPNLFARNERVICVFQTKFGTVVQILVGATITGSIKTSWAGVVNSPRLANVATFNYDQNEKYSTNLKKGEVMGEFRLGSTVITLFSKDAVELNPDLRANLTVKVGEVLATVKQNNTQKTAENLQKPKNTENKTHAK